MGQLLAINVLYGHGGNDDLAASAAPTSWWAAPATTRTTSTVASTRVRENAGGGTDTRADFRDLQTRHVDGEIEWLTTK